MPNASLTPHASIFLVSTEKIGSQSCRVIMQPSESSDGNMPLQLALQLVVKNWFYDP